MYGYQVKSVDDPLIEAADRSILLAGGLLTPNASIINLLPFLAHIPPWLSGPMTSRKIAAEAEGLMKYTQESMLNFAKAAIVCSHPNGFKPDFMLTQKRGTAKPSLLTDFLQKPGTSEAYQEEEQAVQDVAFTTYAGKLYISPFGQFSKTRSVLVSRGHRDGTSSALICAKYASQRKYDRL